MDNRRTETPAERAEREEIEKSLKVSTYIDNDQFWESIHQGNQPQTAHVPNYKQATRGEVLSQVASETHGESIDMDGLYKTAAGNMTPEQVSDLVGSQQSQISGPPATGPRPVAAPSGPRLTLSKNQATAISKYPTVVEFLGRPEGEIVAKEVSGKMNLLIANLIESNSKEANAQAHSCVADKQNLKQYFKDGDWVCRVTASGPFRGDEAIFYSREKDVARVLRKKAVGERISYDDISSNFNIIYESTIISESEAEIEDQTEAVVEEQPVVEAEAESNETLDIVE